ncbi:MAG: phage/plasmid primase, P4 family [Actinomycetia bacterium]|nr:phage/plasmid primase, P4 family [Actinomycetes bacterium]
MFSKFAPLYWAAGLPAIPLRERGKAPAINGWQRYSEALPSPEVQQAWLSAYENCNIGLPLGQQSRLVAIDLDSEDPRVAEVLNSLLPSTPWTRIGKKGSVRIFRFNGEKSARIKDADGNMLFEILSSKTQIVLPPSIHPDTGRPYVSDTNLWEICSLAQPLPADFEVTVRRALIEAGFNLESRGRTRVTNWVAAGARDSTLVSICGMTARDFMHGHLTLLEAVSHVRAWVENYTEQVAGDPMDPQKAEEKLIEFISRDLLRTQRPLPHGWDLGLEPEYAQQMRERFGGIDDTWDYERFVKFAEEGLSKCQDDAQRISVTVEVLEKMAQSTKLNDIEQDSLIKWLHLATGRQMSVQSLRTQYKSFVRGRDGNQEVGQNHTDIANRLIEEMKVYGEARYFLNKWHQWDGACWKVLEEAEIRAVVARNFGHMDTAKRGSDHRGIIGIAEALVSKPIDQHQGINFANGWLTSDLQLMPHDPKWGATYVLPYRYAPEAREPELFMNFLESVWGHCEDFDERVNCLRQVIAAALFGSATTAMRAVVFYGKAHSGKSVLANIIMGLMPEGSICAVAPHNWDNRFAPAQMVGKLLNFCGELSEHQPIDGDRLKSITEGALIQAEHKGLPQFTFRPKCMQLFCSNYLPRSKDIGRGFLRRWAFFNFDRVVSSENKVANLAEMIVNQEREEIAAWAVPAITRYMSRADYDLPPSHYRVEEQLGSQINTVRFFLRSCKDIELTQGTSTKEELLYGKYYGFCRSVAAVKPMKITDFRHALVELFEEFGVQAQHLDRETLYHGVAIRAAV